MGLGAVPEVKTRMSSWTIRAVFVSIHLLGSSFGESLNDGGVGVEQIITGHTGLTGNTSRDDNDMSILEGFFQTIVSSSMASNLHHKNE
jgi:hypothetical protein